ncbi:MAG: Hpt domain-containing protein [Desulforegulaceae bacterium]|nr:Hpt domain-containing protein [Desulforegulaceae bacterium]
MTLKDYAENLGLDEEEFKELTQLFIDTTKKDLEKLKKALKNQDFKSAKEASHSIKGASGNLGFMEIFELASKCEKASEENNFELISNDISKIETLTIKLNELL